MAKTKPAKPFSIICNRKVFRRSPPTSSPAMTYWKTPAWSPVFRRKRCPLGKLESREPLPIKSWYLPLKTLPNLWKVVKDAPTKPSPKFPLRSNSLWKIGNNRENRLWDISPTGGILFVLNSACLCSGNRFSRGCSFRGFYLILIQISGNIPFPINGKVFTVKQHKVSDFHGAAILKGQP